MAETWTYGGIRTREDGHRRHVWLDPDGRERLFKPGTATAGRPAVGGHYTARVTRDAGGGVTLHGTPEYAGTEAGPELRRDLWTRHTVALARIAALRAERDAGRRNALDEAIAPLRELAARLRTGAERDAFAAYVLRQLHGAWITRQAPGGPQ